MTNWRERGYVPPSDGEESDEELETQESAAPRLDDLIPSSPVPRLPWIQSSQVTARRAIQTLDLSNVPNEDESVEEMEIDHEEGGVAIEDTAVKDIIQRFESPDPLTGVPQPIQTPNQSSAPKSTTLDNPSVDPYSSDSSPLSSPPDTPPRPPSLIQPPRSVTTLPTTNIAVEIQLPPRPTSPRSSETPIINPLSPFFRQRTFRQRNPIQQNPYSLEAARYRSTLRKSGVQPVRVLEPEREGQDGTGDSQDAEYVAPPEPEERPPRRPDTRDSPHTPPAAPRSGRPSSGGPKDGHRRVASADGIKRRKINHARGAEVMATVVRSERPVGRANEMAVDLDRRDRMKDIWDFPDSSPPPRARRQTIRQQSPVITSHASKNWPSSPKRGAPDLSWLNSSGSDDDWDIELPIISNPRPHSPVLSHLSSPNSQNSIEMIEVQRNDHTSSASENGSPSGSQPISRGPRKVLQRFKRLGTKGILPASFLRLDAGEQSTPHPRSANTPSELPPDPRPGVARTRISHRPRAASLDLLRNELGDESSDSDSSMDMVLGAAQPRKPRKRRQPETMRTRVVDLVSSDSDSDIPEDNRLDIDFGLASGASRRRKKRQTDIRNSLRAPTATTARAKKSSGRRTQRDGQRQRSLAPRIGIVDVVRHSKATGSAVPQFARIAARTASKRSSKGRQSPLRKVIRLQTAQDTADIDEVLRNWREDTLPFRAAEISDRDRTTLPQRIQARIPSPQPLGGEQRKEASRSRVRTLESLTGARRMRQMDLKGYVAQERQHAPKQKRPPAKNYTVVPGDVRLRTHQPRLVMHPGVYERAINPRDRIRDLADVLRDSVLPVSTRSQQPSSWRTQTQPHQNNVPTAHFISDTGRPQQPHPRKSRRKHIPKRLDIDLAEFRQPPPQDLLIFEPLSPTESVRSKTSLTQASTLQKPVLCGLLPYGSKYSLNFDTHPLKPGTRFNASTFIGQGLLKSVLETPPGRVMTSTRVSMFSFGELQLRWGMYDESVASEFESVCEMIGDAAERMVQANPGPSEEEFRDVVVNAYAFFGFVVRYISRGLQFYDPVDVLPFGQRVLQGVKACAERIVDDVLLGENSVLERPDVRLSLGLRVFALLVAVQVLRLCAGDTGMQRELGIQEYITTAGRGLVRRLLRCDFSAIRRCYEDQRRHIKFEHGIDQEYYTVDLWVLAIQVLGNTGLPGVSFWDIVNEQLNLNGIERSVDVRVFEARWQTLFSLLPLFQFDSSGVAMPLDLLICKEVNWELVQKLVNRPLKLYIDNRDAIRNSTINDYCRVLYARCHHLISAWFWASADQIIPTLYHHFSTLGLSNLPNELSHGAPQFLQNLDQPPSLELQDADRCFHILLKTIALGIRNMATQGLNKQIHRLVFRLNPNNRRSYPRDQNLRREELIPLQNHHDLLTTLYFSAPPAVRLPLQAMRIVDPVSSHHYACNIAVRAWDNLVRFQLRSAEDVEMLRELMEWYEEFLGTVLTLHLGVRGEVGKEVEERKERGFEEAVGVEEGVRRRELQLEAILMDLVTAVKGRLKDVSGEWRKAMLMLTSAGVPAILNTSTKISSKLMIEAMDVLCQFMETCEASSTLATVPVNPPQIQESEESQDYGGSDVFDGFELPDDISGAAVDPAKEAAEHFLAVAYTPLHRTLSNFFGADKPPKDALLVKVVDTWIQVATYLIRHGLKSWESYLEHSNESWSSLRDTPQARKFTPYFLTRVIEHGGERVYHANRDTFLQSWMKCIVEREAGLRYQNELTAAVLNVDAGNSVLRNPPFARDPRKGVFVVTPEQFRLRRLALISGICEDMRLTFTSSPPADKKHLKQHYADLLRSLMRSMRTNYEALLHSPHSTTTSAGAYIAFAQSVISLLQQHTTDIVEIDKYFTDSSAFPLPANDPNYVISRLKKYAATIERPGTQKELNVFLMTQIERVARSGEWKTLVRWIETAVAETVETARGEGGLRGLRGYFLMVLLPAYVECLVEGDVAGVVAWPVLRAAENVVGRLRVGVDAFDPEQRSGGLEMVRAVLWAVSRAVGRIIDTISDLHPPTPHHITTLSQLLSITTALLPSCAHFLYHHHFSPSQYPPATTITAAITTSLTSIHHCTLYILHTSNPPGRSHSRREISRPITPLTLTPSFPASSPTIFAPGAAHAVSELRTAVTERWRMGSCVGIGGQETLSVTLKIGKEVVGVVVPPVMGAIMTTSRRIADRVERLEEVAEAVGLRLGDGDEDEGTGELMGETRRRKRRGRREYILGRGVEAVGAVVW